jgi:preprotein translocase subunit SecB
MEFLKGLRFVGLGLDASSASVNRPALSDVLETSHALETGFAAEYKILAHQKERFVIGASFTLGRKTKDATEPIISIAASYSALFESVKPQETAHIERFSQGEARLIFWPYVRYFITDMSARMSVDQILLPLTSQFEAMRAAAAE